MPVIQLSSVQFSLDCELIFFPSIFVPSSATSADVED